MRFNSIDSGSRIFNKTLFFVLTFAFVCAGLAAGASHSKAAPVQLTFDNGRASFGFFSDRVVLPAGDTFPSPDLPAPQRTDIQLNGDLANGAITIPQLTNSGLQFPYMHIMHPIEQDLKIPLTLRLNSEGLTGTWNNATGAMTLEGLIDVIVVTGTGPNFPLPDSLDDLAVPPLGLFARCRFDNVPMSFSTARKNPITGQAFSGGFGVNGAITASWDGLTPAVSENGGECDQLNQLTTSNGGLWLSNGIVDPIPQPEPPGPTCETDLSLCPDPKYTEIDGVRLFPGRKAVRPGQKIMLRLRVHNSGNAPARKLKVRIRSSKGFRVPKRVVLTVPAGRFASKKFAVRVKRNAKRRGRITAVSNGWRGNAFLRVKMKKRRR